MKMWLDIQVQRMAQINKRHGSPLSMIPINFSARRILEIVQNFKSTRKQHCFADGEGKEKTKVVVQHL